MKRLLAFLACALVFLCFGTAGMAHSPHDPIDVLSLSPDYGRYDHTLFIAISDHLLKSEDGGYQWKQLTNGLQNSHLISSICISPFFSKDKTVFLSTLGDGVYRSEDGGQSWFKENQGLNTTYIEFMKISPHGSIFAVDSSGELWKKERHENRWLSVESGASQITSIGFAAASLDKHVMFLGDRAGNFFISSDTGNSFYKKFTFPDSGPVTVIAASFDSQSDLFIWVGTKKNGIFKSIDGGVSFSPSSNGITDRHIIDISISSGDRSKLYATTWNEAVYSLEAGAITWQLFSKNLTTDRQADTEKYRSPHFRSVRLSKAFESDNTLFLAGFDGLFVSNTGGKEWKQLETLPIGLIKGMDVFSASGTTSTAVTTYGGGAYISDSWGPTWSIANSGLNTTRLSDIKYSPNYHRDNTLFSASMGYLLRSENGGKSWKKASLRYNGFRKRLSAFLNTVTAKLKIRFSWNDLLLRGLEKKRPWPTVIVVSQNFEKDGTLFFGTRYHGLYRSTDRGKINKKVWEGTGRTIPSLVISPNYSSDKTLLASVRGLGVFKSIDEGNSWKDASEGLDFIVDWKSGAVVHQIKKKDIHLVISPNFRQDKTIYAASSQGFYKTTDAAGTWHRIEDPLFNAGDNIIGCAISPNYENDHTLIVSLKGRGLYLTTDGGGSFSVLSRELIHQNHDIEYIKFSPLFPMDTSVFAASDEAVFMTSDSGRHWKMLARPVRYENKRQDVLRYHGDWAVERGREFSANSISVSDTPGSSVALDFVGTGIVWIGSPNSEYRKRAEIFIDGVVQQSVEIQDKPGVISIYGLTPGAHQIRIEVVQNGGTVDTGKVGIDAFDVLP